MSWVKQLKGGMQAVEASFLNIFEKDLFSLSDVRTLLDVP